MLKCTHSPEGMGESGQVIVTPGIGNVQSLFTHRGHKFNKRDEISTAYLYEVSMEAASVETGHNLTESIYSPVPGGAQPVPDGVREGANGRVRRNSQYASFESNKHASSVLQGNGVLGKIKASMTATSNVGLLRFDFNGTGPSPQQPYVFLQATRQNWTGSVQIDPRRREISGSNPQRQDFALGPLEAAGFSGYFVARFSEPFEGHGVTHGDLHSPNKEDDTGQHLGAYVKFRRNVPSVEVRTGVSFVSIEQARRNLDIEASFATSFDQIVIKLKSSWLDKIGRFSIQGINVSDSDHDQRTIFYTSLFHALQYPSDFSEVLSHKAGANRTYYSGYTDSVHNDSDSYYQSWSICKYIGAFACPHAMCTETQTGDTFRAEHSLLCTLAPERVNSMMRSLVRIYQWAGRLPMWANIVETNISKRTTHGSCISKFSLLLTFWTPVIGTHVDAVIANALVRGFREFDVWTAWLGVKKNAYEPPINDTELLYYDREGHTPDEVRAGLTSYMAKGYVANDRWAESGSRTLDYAFDDHAASVVARFAGDEHGARELQERSMNYRNIYNAETGFMEAKNDNGTWAGREQGWTEGDDWIYTFNVMHDPLGLADLMGGRAQMKKKLDEYFQSGFNDHSNEPSHHAPYLYAAIGYPSSTQTLVREIASQNYNATSAGLSGNEDLGQMSAWYVFSALGFYPVNPASDEYVVGAPFFEKVTIRLPAGAATGGIGGAEHTLTIVAPGAPAKPYVRSLKVDGEAVDKPVLHHGQIVTANKIEFEMAETPQAWGHET